MELRITKPDDWHLHLRDGGAMKDVVAHSARIFGRAVVMPNLQPPITTVAEARAYRARILGALPHLRMAPGEKQAVGIADFRLDQAEIACSIKKARIPPFPVRQQLFNLFAQIHHENVTERVKRHNDQVPCYGSVFDIGVS